jgi:nucleoside-diphosphate-sugar epimerase
MIVITGFRGWIGAALVKELTKRGVQTTGVERTEIQTGRWAAPVNTSVAIHLAAIAHVSSKTAPDSAYVKANFEHAVQFALQARQRGIGRFVFVSSARVRDNSAQDPYTAQKRAAETALLAMNNPGVFEVIVIRPPLVYGPGVRANFLQLLKLANFAIPMPMSTVTRHMIYIQNAVDAIIFLSLGQVAGAQIFEPRDEEELSLVALFLILRKAMHNSAPILAINESQSALILKAAKHLPVLGPLAKRIFEPFYVDVGALRSAGWKAPVTNRVALAETAAWFQYGRTK